MSPPPGSTAASSAAGVRDLAAAIGSSTPLSPRTSTPATPVAHFLVLVWLDVCLILPSNDFLDSATPISAGPGSPAGKPFPAMSISVLAVAPGLRAKSYQHHFVNRLLAHTCTIVLASQTSGL